MLVLREISASDLKTLSRKRGSVCKSGGNTATVSFCCSHVLCVIVNFYRVAELKSETKRKGSSPALVSFQ